MSASETDIPIPSDIKDSLQNLPIDQASLLDSLREPGPTSIRLNSGKISPDLPFRKVPWSDFGYYLKERPLFVSDPWWHAGAYYVQEASSMLLEKLVQHLPLTAKTRVLDLCAAPGGKSTHLIDLLPEKAVLMSNEVVKSRAAILAENITRYGNHRIIVGQNDPSNIGQLGAMFDLVLVDAPCSGEGMFRKDKRARTEWSLDHVKMCAERQKRILGDIWPSIKSGGYLIYSTCTFNTQENEENVKWMLDELGAENVKLPMPEGVSPSTNPSISAWRCFPHLLEGEGLFMSVVQKSATQKTFKLPKKWKGRATPIDPLLFNWLYDPESLCMLPAGDRLALVPKTHARWIQYVQSRLNIRQAGVMAGQAGKKDWIPEHPLALSTILNLEKLPTVELDQTTAVRFLRKDPFMIEGKKGWLLPTFKGVALGWTKYLGNRLNNYLPQEWRIRMDEKQITDQVFTLAGNK